MFTISNFAPETVITLENVKEVLADMGVEYTLKKYAKVASMPSIYKDGKAYEIKSTVCRGYRKGVSKTPNSRLFLVGKTIQEVLNFLNGVDEKTAEESADNYIQRPNLKASAHITIDGDKPIVLMQKGRKISTVSFAVPKREAAREDLPTTE